MKVKWSQWDGHTLEPLTKDVNWCNIMEKKEKYNNNLNWIKMYNFAYEGK